jgi:hypothetical protein
MAHTDLSSVVKQLFKQETENYLFIYTPPKVGSTTLVTSLRVSLGNTCNIIHIHDELMLQVLTGIQHVKIMDIIYFLSNQGKKVWVIDIYRTPIERKISVFFEKVCSLHFNNVEEQVNQYKLQRIMDRFNKVFPHLENGDHYLDEYGLPDVPAFDVKKKYTAQLHNGVTFIKLRLCDTHHWSAILSSLLQTSVVLIADNETDKKAIGPLYEQFKTEYKVPAAYLEEIKSSKSFLFYYSETERNAYLHRWTKRVDTEWAMAPYTAAEYTFYLQLCLENQHINDIQLNHYIDNGCFCKGCSNKRADIYHRAKEGETHFAKIIHTEVVMEANKQRKVEAIIRKKKKSHPKFETNQFKIKHHWM